MLKLELKGAVNYIKKNNIMIGLIMILIKVVGGKIGIAKAGLLIAKNQALKALFYEFSNEIIQIGQRAILNPSVQQALPGWAYDFIVERIEEIEAAIIAIREFLDNQ